MGTIILGSSANRKGITVNPNEVFFNGNVVKAIMSGVVEIWSGAKSLVPTLTSNKGSDGGEASGSIGNAWYAFDGNDSTEAATSGQQTGYIQYKFVVPTIVKKFYQKSGNTRNYKISASNDGNTWTDLYLGSTTTNPQEDTISITNNNYYLYYRYTITSLTSGATGGLHSLQFYGRQLVGLVPTMTSNTTPYGEVSASSNSNIAFYAFDGTDGVYSTNVGDAQVGTWVQYKFPKGVCVNAVELKNITNNVNCISSYCIKGSNDGNEWFNISGTLSNSIVGNAVTFNSFNNNKTYTYYRLEVLGFAGAQGTNNLAIGELQFYGEKALYEPLIPTMTSNTTPSGVASAISVYGNGFEAWNAFDNSLSTAFLTASNTKTSDYYLQYDFGKTVCVKRAELLASTDKQTYNVKIQASNNGTTWDDVSDGVDIITTGGLSTAKSVDVDMSTNENYYRYYRAVMNSDKCSTQYSCVEGSYSFQIVKLQLYK